jgi:hypothetical protein
MQRLFFILLTCILIKSTDAQEIKVVRDFRIQTELGIEKKFFNRWAIQLENSDKWIVNASRLDELNFDLGLKYKPYKILTVGGGYRFTIDRKKDTGYNIFHRYMLDLSMSRKFGRFIPDYRIRYQNMDDELVPFDDASQEMHILRNRLQVSYNIRNSKFDPFIYSELYGVLSKYHPFPLKVKTALGCKYRFNKFGVIKVSYRIDRELNNNYPFTYSYLELGYAYSF